MTGRVAPTITGILDRSPVTPNTVVRRTTAFKSEAGAVF
ncbi:hypothetical protein [Azospirillum endophyticum]